MINNPYCRKSLMVMIMQILIAANNSSKDNGQVSILHVLIIQIRGLLSNFYRVKMHEILFFFFTLFLVVDCLCNGLYHAQIQRALVMQENFLVGCKY